MLRPKPEREPSSSKTPPKDSPHLTVGHTSASLDQLFATSACQLCKLTASYCHVKINRTAGYTDHYPSVLLHMTLFIGVLLFIPCFAPQIWHYKGVGGVLWTDSKYCHPFYISTQPTKRHCWWACSKCKLPYNLPPNWQRSKMFFCIGLGLPRKA